MEILIQKECKLMMRIFWIRRALYDFHSVKCESTCCQADNVPNKPYHCAEKAQWMLYRNALNWTFIIYRGYTDLSFSIKKLQKMLVKKLQKMLEYSGSVPMHERFIDALIYTTVQAEEKKAPIFIKATKFILKPNNMEAALRVWNKKKNSI